jgi:hypothetical protein
MATSRLPAMGVQPRWIARERARDCARPGLRYELMAVRSRTTQKRCVVRILSIFYWVLLTVVVVVCVRVNVSVAADGRNLLS